MVSYAGLMFKDDYLHYITLAASDPTRGSWAPPGPQIITSRWYKSFPNDLVYATLKYPHDQWSCIFMYFHVFSCIFSGSSRHLHSLRQPQVRIADPPGVAPATLRASVQHGLWSAWRRTPALRPRRHHRPAVIALMGRELASFLHDLWWNMAKYVEMWWNMVKYGGYLNGLYVFFQQKTPNMAMVDNLKQSKFGW